MISRLLNSDDAAIRRLAGDPQSDPLESWRVHVLLRFPPVHPYRKWYGTHWRLVALADLGVTGAAETLQSGVECELGWLTSDAHRRRIQRVNGLFRRCASQEGNGIYACSRLGFASDARVSILVESLLEWQWPDGGWNCDLRATARRSSFHETVTPAIGLATYSLVTGDSQARESAIRAAELLLEHRLFRSLSSGAVIHPSWMQLHYPPYWHYDILQGLRLLMLLELLQDARAQEALDHLEGRRRRDGRFSGPSWTYSSQAEPGQWGRGPANEMLNVRAEIVLAAAARSDVQSA